MKYAPRTFTLPSLSGISEKQINEHLKLYQGYVTHVNKIYDELAELGVDGEKNAHIMQELRRRLGFEFNGMRLHEFYFGDLEGGAKTIPDGALKNALMAEFQSPEAWSAAFKKVIARGSGWVIMNYDNVAKRFHLNWVTNHDEGQMATLPAIVVLDMWEHAFMVDYLPGDKMKYVDSYLAALNWETIAKRFEAVA
jgi:Fe-Mn family superoxide dismutase